MGSGNCRNMGEVARTRRARDSRVVCARGRVKEVEFVLKTYFGDNYDVRLLQSVVLYIL